MRISDLLTGKGSFVLTLGATSSVRDLLAALAEHNVGAAVVTEKDRIAGIVSERDVVRRLHARGPNLLGDPIAGIMTTVVATCRPTDDVETLTVLMTEKRVRHVPVVDDAGALAGIVSIGDVVKSRIDQLEDDRRQLEAYISQG